MSQHSLMSTQERKMQAAAICREIHATDEPEMDLGKKVSAPREIMLEELSLASNRGSRLFKMRQKRSEKYTFESIQNEANTQHSNNAIYPGQDILSNVNDLGNDQAPKTVNSAPNPENIAPGYGGPLKDVPAEKFNSTAMPRSYQSPWEQALINDPSLADTLVAQVPKPEPRHEIPQFKSFNRVAIPFGGFGKAPKVAVKPLDVDLGIPKPITPVADPVIKRPTFNRTASGWVNDSVPLRLHLEPISSMSSTFAPESDDL
ncbi:myozenin-2a isoform X1 [Triplophysa rosa]|uniref:myozenin-2a isoform X1 n=2 Tax=Triplophysa rosa TaxID=992332 RepID=UPI002545F2DA|nr:myozenin-2a isoform X1 [Triplophysa rosa]XP_057207910.1 myozenin-2a isoform X1 [Triplophysa rosa]